MIEKLPFVWRFARQSRIDFDQSTQYWKDRYKIGGNSGAGSYGRLAQFKAATINAFVARNRIQSIIEFGCGDGNQLALAHYPKYIGLDISESVVKICKARFELDPSKSFHVIGDGGDVVGETLRAELTLSLDVIYHLVEDPVFEKYVADLFDAADRFVIIYSSDDESISSNAPHVRHRNISRWVSEHIDGWHLHEKIPNLYPADANSPNDTSFADFMIFERILDHCGTATAISGE